MSNADLPIHVQMLMALRAKVEGRQKLHEAKCGGGLEDRDYQRHVGRIAECKHVVELVNEMMRADLDDVSDFLESEKNERKTQRTQRGARTGQRRPNTPADYG